MKRILFLVSFLVLVLLSLGILTASAGAFVSTGDGGWVWLSPLPQGNILRAVEFVDASHLWAVGDGGTILFSTDGGATWTGQASGVTGSLSSVSFPDASHGWVTGAQHSYGDGILMTSDGGVHWRVQPVGFALNLKDVCFTDALHGCAVGDGGAAVTSDGGMTWRQTSDQRLSAVTFSDASHGCAVGGSAVLTTSDGGETWTLPTYPWSEYAVFNDVSFSDALHGWIVGSTGVLATVDGGTTWALQNASVTGDSVSFADAFHGWVASGTVVRATGDGGLNWTDQPTESAVTDVSFTDLARGCAVGGGGYAVGHIETTGDGGATWTRRDAGFGVDIWFRGVTFADASHGWAAANTGVYATGDGGETWDLQKATDGWLYSVSFPDARNGWAAGQSGTMLHTADGGVTWEEQATGLAAGLYLSAVSFPDSLHGWAVGNGGVVATPDGGETWSTQDDTPLLDVCFVDPLHGWAVGDWYYWPPQGVGWWDGIIMATSDGGVTWTVQMANTGGRLYAVDFCDALHGWAVGQTVMKTSDGGLTWTAQQPPGSGELNDVECLSPDRCWAVGASSRVINTSDGGATWHAQNIGKARESEDVLSSVDFVDATRGWVVGSDGAILKTTNGGVGPDITPPVTLVVGAFDRWSRLPVALTFVAMDDGWGVTGTGVAATQFSLDDGVSWSDGTTMTVPAPADHSNDGSTFVAFRSRDNAGNVESTRVSPGVNIDTRKPSPRAPSAASARRGRTAALKYKIVDAAPNGGTASVTIKVKNRAGKVVKTLKQGEKPVGKALTAKFTVPRTWKPGTYKFLVYATDTAGNKQANVASNKLIVK